MYYLLLVCSAEALVLSPVFILIGTVMARESLSVFFFFLKIKSKTKETVMRRHFQSCRFMPALDERMQLSSCESGLACILPRTQETRMQMPLFFSWPAVSQDKHVLDGQGAEGTCASCVLTEEREARRNQAIRAGNCDPRPNVIIIM